MEELIEQIKIWDKWSIEQAMHSLFHLHDDMGGKNQFSARKTFLLLQRQKPGLTSPKNFCPTSISLFMEHRIARLLHTTKPPFTVKEEE